VFSYLRYLQILEKSNLKVVSRLQFLGQCLGSRPNSCKFIKYSCKNFLSCKKYKSCTVKCMKNESWKRLQDIILQDLIKLVQDLLSWSTYYSWEQTCTKYQSWKRLHQDISSRIYLKSSKIFYLEIMHEKSNLEKKGFRIFLSIKYRKS
jgi:hypothetical protein